MLETYETYGTYDTAATMIRELIQEVADDAMGTRQVTLPDGSTYDLDGEWTTLEMYPSLSEARGGDHARYAGCRAMEDRRSGWRRDSHRPRLWARKTDRGTMGTPGRRQNVRSDFVRDFPVETSPLTRQHRSIAGVTEKWDLYVRGFELATGYWSSSTRSFNAKGSLTRPDWRLQVMTRR